MYYQFLIDVNERLTFCLQSIDEKLIFSWYFPKVLIFHLFFEYVPFKKQAPKPEETIISRRNEEDLVARSCSFIQMHIKHMDRN